MVRVAGVEQHGGVGVRAQGDLDALGGAVQLAGAFDEVAEDRVGRRGRVAVLEAAGEAAVDRVAQDAERDVEVDGERGLGGERVEVEGAGLRGERVSIAQRLA